MGLSGLSGVTATMASFDPVARREAKSCHHSSSPNVAEHRDRHDRQRQHQAWRRCFLNDYSGPLPKSVAGGLGDLFTAGMGDTELFLPCQTEGDDLSPQGFD